MRRAALAASALALLATLAGCAVDGQNGAAPGSSAGGGQAGVVPGSGEESDVRRRARIRVELAASYYQQGNLQVALDELGQALRADPDYPAAYDMLGLVYWALNDRARAEESFQRGLRLAPNDASLNNNFGWFLCNTGRERESIARFEQALRDPLYQTPTKALHSAGICSLRLGEKMAAETYFQRAFQVDASNPVAMFNLGQIFLERGELERARHGGMVSRRKGHGRIPVRSWQACCGGSGAALRGSARRTHPRRRSCDRPKRSGCRRPCRAS